MSLAFNMKSWCKDFENKYHDRSTAIAEVKKHSDHVIKNHKDHRVKMGIKMREILQIERLSTKKKVFIMLKSYLKDRNSARDVLFTMRG